MTLVDTSAFYAYLDGRDLHHQLARTSLAELLDEAADLVTHNYVLVESSALIQRRLGADAVRVFLDDLVPVVRVLWVDEAMHRLATAAMLGSLGRSVSLVDWTSFVMMRELRIDRAFVFDADFAAQGIQVYPDSQP